MGEHIHIYSSRGAIEKALDKEATKSGPESYQYHLLRRCLAILFWKVITLTKSGLLAYGAAIRDIASTLTAWAAS